MAAVAAEIEATPVGDAWIIAATYGGRLLHLEVVEETSHAA
jgi:hypothetical protein